jgi:signal transduction histidine kinase
LTPHSRAAILRTATLYLAIFTCVLAALSAGAYAFVWREYVSLLAPALSTPEGAAALDAAMRRVALTILEIDVPLVLVVAAASFVLARAAIAPLEAARERERQFAADAAHGLRSPLAAIAAVAQAARSRANAGDRDDFETIARAALEASGQISDLLTLARDPGPAVLQREPVDLASVVGAIFRELEPVARARGIRLDVDAGSAVVHGDDRRLREMARNLLDNAVRHACSRALIASRRSGRNGELIVEDDGEGIALADRQRVFERYYRRHNDGTGSGLGLAIVRWVARAHGGDVVAATAPQGGARFVASIPAHDV